MLIIKKIAIATAALVILGACETTNAGMEQVRKTTSAGVKQVQKINPFKGEENGETTQTKQNQTVTPAPASGSYQLPTGGTNTFSFSIANCSTCPYTNVMVDPDNYWQRRDSKSAVSGQGRVGLYNDVTNAFQAQGFYAFQGEVNIRPGNSELCPSHKSGAQSFQISMKRNSGARLVYFDGGCSGSASADGAAAAINSVIGISDFAAIVAGEVD